MNAFLSEGSDHIIFEVVKGDRPSADGEGSEIEESKLPHACPCRKLKPEHIGDVIRRELAVEARDLPSGRRAGAERPSSAIGECEPRCSIFDTN